jgi:acetyl-CoA/propionyl-CoA carboxylase biotin carboxyl carrier protein
VDQPLQRCFIELEGKRVALGLPASLLQAWGSVSTTASPAAAPAAEASADAITAPMAGSLVQWKLADGAAVQAGDVVAVMESMKMESPITAPQAGRLQQQVAPGAVLQAGQVIARVVAGQ